MGSTFDAWSGDADCSDGAITLTAIRNCTATFRLQTFDLTVIKAGNGLRTVTASLSGIDCGLDCTEPYDFSQTVTLTPKPTTGSTFSIWGGDADCIDGSVTVTGVRNCTATFTLQTFPLIVATNGTGSGTVTVTSQFPGIDCGLDCSETYNFGSDVVLTPVPATGSSFTGWQGDIDCSDGTVLMSIAHNCTATFNLKTSTLSIKKVGTGTGTVTSRPSGIDCGLNCVETYLENTIVNLTPTAATGSVFTGWSGDLDCLDGSVTLAAVRDRTATFNLKTFDLGVTVIGKGVGIVTVTSSPLGIDCGLDCSEIHDFNTVISLTAIPATGSTFSGWTGDADCSDGSVTMSALRNCTATFTLQTFALTVSRDGTGSGTSGTVGSAPIGINCGIDCTDGSVTMTAARNSPPP